MSLRWLTAFLDFPADSFDAGVAFWREATGSRVSHVRGAAGEFATLLPPSGDAYLRVQRVAKGDGGFHLDLHVDTATRSLSETADQAEALGARIQLVGDGLIVTDSPGGFTFCLVPWLGETVVPTLVVTDGGAVSRLDALCLDIPSAAFERECSFWMSLTGFETRPAGVAGFFYLSGQAGMPVLLMFQRLDRADPGQRVRAHADIGTTDRDRVVARHLTLGATAVATFPSWTVLADPTGHHYCLVSRDPDIAGGSGSASSG